MLRPSSRPPRVDYRAPAGVQARIAGPARYHGLERTIPSSSRRTDDRIERHSSHFSGRERRMSEFPCPTCDRVFDTQRRRRIHYNKAHDGRFPNRTCAACGSKFYCEYKKKYCSATCREQNTSNKGSNNPNYNGGKTVGTCELCDVTFEYYPSEKEGRYCPDCVQTEDWQTPPTAVGEDNPRWNGGKRQVDCVMCDTTVERYPSNIGDVVVCSEGCRRDWLSQRFSGSKHPNWKGGGNPEYGTGWNEVRRDALERDGHRCLVCETTRGKTWTKSRRPSHRPGSLVHQVR